MDQVKFVVKDKKTGEEKTGEVFLPTDLHEAVSIFQSEAPLLKWARATLLIRAQRRLSSNSKPRRRIFKIALNEITPEQKTALEKIGLLKTS